MWSSIFNPEKPKVRKPVEWRRLHALFKPYLKEELLILLCIIATSVLGLLPPLFTMSLIDKAIPSGRIDLVVTYVVLMIVAAIVAGGITIAQGYLNALMGEAIVRDIRCSLVSHLHRMPMDFFTSTKTGEILNRVNNDVESIDNVLTGTLVPVLSNFLIILTTVVTIFVLNWKLAIVSLAVIPLMIFPIWPVGHRMYEARKKTRTKRDDISVLTQETLSISGITLIKSFGREPYERDRFYKEGTDLMHQEINLAMVGRWFLAVATGMVTIGPSIVWLYGGWLAISKDVTVGIVVTFVALLGRLYAPAAALAGVQIQVVGALAVFERIFEYLDMTEENSRGTQLIETVLGRVEFENVDFSYSEDRTALKDVSFVVEPGKMAALVGHSGAGKSTITQLLPRFYDPQGGSIKVDGIDVRDLELQSLRSHIGTVTQETYLFHDTIENNLRYAAQEISDDQMHAAARAANIHEFIMSLPLAYKTIVGERGHKLSGGERQRLAIARVLLKNPKILILDEATSSLDSENESLIQKALVPLMEGRTSLVIAHRLSTILAADVIFVVDNGRIVESGQHAQLLKLEGAYARLYRQQFKDAAPAALA
jgi:ATP-binding cassette subfamily B protein